jgi:phospholipase C
MTTSIALILRNYGSNAVKVSVLDAYSSSTHTRLLHPHDSASFVSNLHRYSGWYDLTVTVDSDPSFVRQLAGHVETGRPSSSDPAIAATTAQAVAAG